MAKRKLGEIDGLNYPLLEGMWEFGDDDFALMAMLQDPIYCAELLVTDSKNHEYAGQYRVLDYQYPLNRSQPGENYKGYACARSTGKTESIKNKSLAHPFRREAENLLVTAPELIHLLPLTDAIEDRINSIRLTREFLDLRGGKTGFTHRPFGVEFLDGTKIVGRIPRLTGTGVKGQHQPDLLVDEAQDYPERGWTEIHETVIKDHTDIDGTPDFHYEFYGVHTGARDSGFFRRVNDGGFEVVNVTALQRPGWNAAEKRAARAAYGGTQSSDYRRNILGEPGAASSAYFVTSRLMACLDQNRDSDYNQIEYRHIELRAEEFDEMLVPISEALDLPIGLPGEVWAGADLGLNQSPTVISIFNHVQVGRAKERRMKLIRRIHLERFRTNQIVDAWLAIGAAYGSQLKGFGVDSTGLGYPIVQAMEDNQQAPRHLLSVTRGYFFNANVPVSVDRAFVSADQSGVLRDQYGSAVKLETDPVTGVDRYVTYQRMIEASTRYLREMVDQTFPLLPFDTAVVADMQGETQQRVKLTAELKRKPNMFHILDSFRAFAMVFRSGEVEEKLLSAHESVLDRAVEIY